jgi:hypothetical protein
MNGTLQWLMKWCQYTAFNAPEHLSEFYIDTLDNSGWAVRINLANTPMKSVPFEKIEVDNGDNDWFVCKIMDSKFTTGGPVYKICFVEQAILLS